MIKNFYVRECSEPQVSAIVDSLIDSYQIKALAQDQPFETSDAVFCVKDGKLVLEIWLDQKVTQLYFDLNQGEVAFRANKVSKSNEIIAKALGCKSHFRPTVLDATAGMGRDALIMAMLGCKVEMHERNWAIFELLKDALQRLFQDPDYTAIRNKLSLSKENSIESLQGTSAKQHIEIDKFDVIYLDPMFPERKKTALVKKEMRLFKLLAGEDPDSSQLFLNAINSGVKRVVVKRPKGAPFLNESKPSHQILAKKFRYDIYLLNQLSSE
ncbi:class I SAM-dependent methyltransferase [Aliikangiella sp. IMCC44632]